MEPAMYMIIQRHGYWADITGGRPRARGLAAGVPLWLPNIPLWLSHCAMQTFPLCSQKDQFSFPAALLLFFVVNSKGGSS